MSEITKKALATSLKKLLSKKELSKITITNITKDCGVNRQTFYYNFKDVYDLLEWIYMNEVIQSMEGNDTYDTWQQGFLSIFEYVLENKEFVKNTYYSISRDFFLRFIYKQTTVLLMNIIDEKSKGMKVRREDKQFMADFYKYGFVGIMQDCKKIAKEFKQEGKELKQYIDYIVDIFGLISDELKEDIITVCLLICAIDGNISAKEKNWIKQLID